MTPAPGRRQRLTDELRRARAATGGWIDTDFYKGFMQVFRSCIFPTRENLGCGIQEGLL